MIISKVFFDRLVKRVLKIASGEDGILSGSTAIFDFSESFSRETKRLKNGGNYCLDEFLIIMETCLKVACVRYEEPGEEKNKMVIESLLTQVDNETRKAIKKLLAEPEFLRKKESIVSCEVEEAKFRVEQAKDRSYPTVLGGEPGVISGDSQPPINSSWFGG